MEYSAVLHGSSVFHGNSVERQTRTTHLKGLPKQDQERAHLPLTSCFNAFVLVDFVD